MLTFLDALCHAIMSRNAAAVHELLQHPMAAMLPHPVRQEARELLEGTAGPFVAPVQTLRLYHQTAHLLGVRADPATRVGEDLNVASQAPAESHNQMELPLPARVA